MRMRSIWVVSMLALTACSGDPENASAGGGTGGTAAGGSGQGAASGSSGQGGGPGTATVTFHEHLEPLLQKHCQSCHHEGGLAPFGLQSFDEARTYGPLSKNRVQARTMPPWGAFDTEDCKVGHPFREDLRLTQDEIDLFGAWVDQGMAEGDPARAPAALTFSDDKLAGATDHFAAAQPYVVKAGLADEFRCFVFDPELAEDTWVNGFQVEPGNNKVVHHALVFADPGRKSLDKAAVGSSYPCFGGPGIDGDQKLLLAWAPGAQAADYPDNIAMKVDKGSLLVMQVHYHPTANSDEADLTRVALRRAAQAPEWVADVVLIGNARSAKDVVKLLPGDHDPPTGPAFVIPPDVSDHVESMEFTFPQKIGGFPLPELHLSTVGTHMHLVGRSMRIEIERAAPTSTQPAQECLLETPQWDFNWQRGYTYDRPIEQLPTINAGDKLKLRCLYDNTMNNPFVQKALAEHHQTAPSEVKLGEETFDEMCLGAFTFFRKSIGGL